MSTMTPTSMGATIRATVTTQSGTTYQIQGDTLVLEGPDELPFQEFTLISLDGGRLIYTDGEKVFESSRIQTLSTA